MQVPMRLWLPGAFFEQASAEDQLHALGLLLDLSINISPNNLREPDFPIVVQRLMRSYQSTRGAITLEVTETSMMQDPAAGLTLYLRWRISASWVVEATSLPS